ncbi:MAG: site-specific integrase [Clostridia bacterium]|nr:site-specific integrase [Clostridia bacterium]
MTRRSDGLWQEAITINGKRKYFYGKTKAEVLKKLRDYQGETEQGRLFREVAEEWWEEHSQKVVPSTMSGYNARFLCAVEYFDDKRIKDITPQDVTKLLKSLQDKKYSQKVISTQLNVINMIINVAIINGDITYNPCSAVQIPKGLPKKKRELPTDKEFEIVENSDWLFPFFLLYTGCRRGEALAVTYEDIDWEKKVIHINKAVGFKGNIPYIKSTKTEAGHRDVVLLDKLAARLDRSKTGLIFPNNKGELWHDSMVQRKWKQWQRRYNTSVTAHQLRHGYATILFEAGLEPKDAQYLLGHSTISMTQDIYTHIRQARQQEYAVKLNDFLNK